MKAYPPDDERFVKRQTSVKDWPVFSDLQRVIIGPGEMFVFRSFRIRGNSGRDDDQPGIVIDQSRGQYCGPMLK